MRENSFGHFVLRVAAWLPLAFALWYIAAPLLVWPVTLLSTGVARGAFGDLVRGVEQNGQVITFVTGLRPGQATTSADAVAVLSFDVNVLVYSFGLPMLAALSLAARRQGWWRTLLLGYLVLLPFETWSVVAELLKDVAIGAGPAVASQTGFTAIEREVIAFAYQFGSLILPAVAPAVVWVLTHRRFLESLSGVGRRAQET